MAFMSRAFEQLRQQHPEHYWSIFGGGHQQRPGAPAHQPGMSPGYGRFMERYGGSVPESWGGGGWGHGGPTTAGYQHRMQQYQPSAARQFVEADYGPQGFQATGGPVPISGRIPAPPGTAGMGGTAYTGQMGAIYAPRTPEEAEWQRQNYGGGRMGKIQFPERLQRGRQGKGTTPSGPARGGLAREWRGRARQRTQQLRDVGKGPIGKIAGPAFQAAAGRGNLGQMLYQLQQARRGTNTQASRPRNQPRNKGGLLTRQGSGPIKNMQQGAFTNL